jgi:hypothetical protein
METLSRADRLRLMKFVCSFAWTDLRITPEERELIQRLTAHFGFEDDDRKQIHDWLEVPPPAEEVDPTEIPRAHRKLFLEAAKQVIEIDGHVVAGERDSLALFRELLED